MIDWLVVVWLTGWWLYDSKSFSLIAGTHTQHRPTPTHIHTHNPPNKTHTIPQQNTHSTCRPPSVPQQLPPRVVGLYQWSTHTLGGNQKEEKTPLRPPTAAPPLSVHVAPICRKGVYQGDCALWEMCVVCAAVDQETLHVSGQSRRGRGCAF